MVPKWLWPAAAVLRQCLAAQWLLAFSPSSILLHCFSWKHRGCVHSQRSIWLMNGIPSAPDPLALETPMGPHQLFSSYFSVQLQPSLHPSLSLLLVLCTASSCLSLFLYLHLLCRFVTLIIPTLPTQRKHYLQENATLAGLSARSQQLHFPLGFLDFPWGLCSLQ